MTVSLITGGAGFIGSHVYDHLIKMDHKVIVLDDLSGGSIANLPKDAIVVGGSILNTKLIDELFQMYHFDYVFHLAAYAAEGLSHFIRRYNCEVNVIGSVNLINAAVNYGVKRFVFTSSVAVYGLNAHGAGEHQTPTPIDPYGIAKYAVELDLLSAGRMFGLDFTIFRPGNVYGPRQNLTDGYRNACAIFMRQCLQGQPITIYGTGTQTRQFTYVDDVAPHIARCVDLKHTANQIYNIGTDIATSVSSVAAEVSFATGKRLNEIHLPGRFEALSVEVDHLKFAGHFNRSVPPSYTPLAVGIKKMVAWAKTQTLRDPEPFTEIEITKNLPEHWRKLHEH